MEYETRGRTGTRYPLSIVEDCGPPYAAAPQALERLVGLLEREQLHLGAHRDLRRQRQELLPVAPGEVGHRADHPLPPQVVVGERGDVAHVDAAADHHSPFRHRPQRQRHQVPRRSEDDGRVQRAPAACVAVSPAHSAPICRANSWEAVSPGRVKAKTRRPWWRATCVTMCAAAPYPYSPSRSASPVMQSER